MIAIISDLHSNLEAVSAAFADIERQGIRKVYCLGDVVGYGANPREVLRLVMEKCQVTLLGNHENALMFYPEDFSEKARIAIEWTRTILNSAEYSKEENYRFWGFLGDRPKEYREEKALYVHGSPRNPLMEYMLPRDVQNQTKMKAVFAVQDRAVCFVGHSHVPGVYTEDCKFLAPENIQYEYELPETGKTLINVGSVGQPRDGDTRLSYVSYDGKRVRFHRIAYDHKAASEKIRATPGLPVFLAERLLVGR